MNQLGITGMKNTLVGISKTLTHYIGFYIIELWVALGVRSIHTRYLLVIIIPGNFNIFINTQLKII